MMRTHLGIFVLCALIVNTHGQVQPPPTSSTALNATTSSASLAPATLNSSTSSAPAATHTVRVGDNSFSYEPDSLTANVGDVVVWHFYPLNHSVVQAAYRYPCVPLQYTNPNVVGFYSGIHLEPNGLPVPIPSYQIVINDTNPIFYYCSTPGSCNVKGMVGVINPTDAQTLAVQQALALKAPFVLGPGEIAPAEGPTTTNAYPSVATSSAISTTPSIVTVITTASANPTATPAVPATQAPKPISGGAIGGIAIGGVAVLALIAALIFFFRRRRTTRSPPPPPPPPSHPQAPSYYAEMSSHHTHPNDTWKYGTGVDYNAGRPPPMPSPGVPPSYFMPHRRGSGQAATDSRGNVYAEGGYGDQMPTRTTSPQQAQAHELETPLGSARLF